jgi:Right handed beta helix region
MLKKHIFINSLFWTVILIIISFSRAAATNITACGTFGSGSYVVLNNISSVNVLCLQFTAGPVTLDLNGFTMSGSGNHHGVFANGVAFVTVRNGTIKGFSRSIGITGSNAVIDGVNAVSGVQNGITVGDNATVRNSQVTGHVGGIFAGMNATIVGNKLTGNSGQIIVVSDGSAVERNIVTQNDTRSSPIRITQDCRVINNVVSSGAVAVAAGDGAHNVISGNTIGGVSEGIQVFSDHSIITGNNITGCGDNGVEVGNNSVISGNDVSSNGGDGIIGGAGTQFLNNVVNDSGGRGIQVGIRGLAIGNVVNGSGTIGLDVTCPSKVDNNSATANTTHNIQTSGAGCLLTNNLAP